jgi:nucleoside-diphosphate-sugar epimerase
MKTVLITGIAGEVGSSLARDLAELGGVEIVGVDAREPGQAVERLCRVALKGDIVHESVFEDLGTRFEFDTIFHLAGILSSGGERNPSLAQKVNVTGTVNVLELARRQTERRGSPTKVIFTSSIAAYGLPTLEAKRSAGAVLESQFTTPLTMYGLNKLYCEQLGSYYAEHFGLLQGGENRARIDFRAVRYPGILSAHTLPTGGTSDYAPEMVHSLAQGLAYRCFVREDARLPFLVMPDALRALHLLSQAPREALTQRVYNVGGFSPSAGEIAKLCQREFGPVPVSHEVHPERQRIVDSWPEAVDDNAARRDWGWNPEYSFESGFGEYLFPEVSHRYASKKAANE